MKFNELTIQSKKSRQRVGRGTGSGRGKTAGRGTKGQRSRSGAKLRPGFEGGQNPLMRRIPKTRGFRSFRTPATAVNISRLAAKADVLKDGVTGKSLTSAGIIDDDMQAIKLIGNIKLDQPFSCEVQAVSEAARKSIEAAGGSINLIPTPIREAKNPKAVDAEKKS